MAGGRRAILLFALRALAWLGPCLAAWYFASSALAWAPVRVAGPLLSIAGLEVERSKVEDGLATFEAQVEAPYRPGAPAGQGAVIGIDVKTRPFTFGLALFAALVLAAGRPWRPAAWALGGAALVLLPAWGITFDALRQVASVREIAGILGWAPLAREAIAFGYQAGSLLLPTLAPVGLWVSLDPRFARPG